MNNIADQCLKEASHFPNNRVGAVLNEAVKEMSRLEAIVLDTEAELARCRAANVYDAEAHRKAAEFEVALTKVHGIVAEYWGPCPGSVETLLTIRDVLGTKDWRPNVNFMPRLLTQTETKGDAG